MNNRVSRPLVDRRVDAIVNRTINSVKELQSIMLAATTVSEQIYQPEHSLEGKITRYSDFANTLMLEKRDRTIILGPDMMGDPAFDMLLDLFVAQEESVDISVSSLCYGTCLPQTTALRWVKIMVDRGMILRKSDTNDKRRVYLLLAPQTRLGMIRYLDRVAQRRGITLRAVIG